MSWMNRSVEQCPFRRVLSNRHRHDELAHCELLSQITSVSDQSMTAVGRDACDACTQSFPPTVYDINPIVASLTYRVAENVVAQGGVQGCDKTMATKIRQWALANLPLTGPNESEAVTHQSRFSPEQIRAACPRIETLLPKPPRKSGAVKEWAVGVTTAPRRLPTLEYCLASLRNAGWSDFRIFSDADSTVADRCGQLPVTYRESNVGAWPNFYLGLSELFLRQPKADAFMMIQDDALLFEHPDLRGYLESILWPSGDRCIISLYCSQEYERQGSGWHRFPGQWHWGAPAFVFSSRAVQEFLASHQTIQHRLKPRIGLALVDHLIGRWAFDNNVPIYFPTPSLARHIGHVSALWRNARVAAGRREGRFAGDLLLDQPQHTITRASAGSVDSCQTLDLDQTLYLDTVKPDSVQVGYGSAGRFGELGFANQVVAVDDKRYSHALSTHAPARITFQLDGQFDIFCCDVALNETASAESECSFWVYADGRAVAAATCVRAGQSARRLQAEIAGAKELELRVETQWRNGCHSVWLEPRVGRAAARSHSNRLIDPLGRTEIHLLDSPPHAERCIATIASDGLEHWLDDMLGSLLANGNCRDAALVVFVVGNSPKCRHVAKKYGCTIVQCDPRVPVNATVKSALYSIAHVINAEHFLCLDADTLVLDDLSPIFATQQAHPETAIFACYEKNERIYQNLRNAFFRCYFGTEYELSNLLRVTSREQQYKLVVNDGVFAGRRSALIALDSTMRMSSEIHSWVDRRQDVVWRNQFVFNLMLARMDCGVELDPTYNLMARFQDADIGFDSGRLRATWNGRQVRVIHFAGLSRHHGMDKYSEFRGYFRRGMAPPAGNGQGDA